MPSTRSIKQMDLVNRLNIEWTGARSARSLRSENRLSKSESRNWPTALHFVIGVSNERSFCFNTIGRQAEIFMNAIPRYVWRSASFRLTLACHAMCSGDATAEPLVRRLHSICTKPKAGADTLGERVRPVGKMLADILTRSFDYNEYLSAGRPSSA